jgi:MscS family membrane protein
MTEFFQRTYYGNTVLDWLTTFLMILGVVVLGRLFYMIVARALKRLASRSRFQIDDILVDSFEEPVTVILVLAASRLALGRLALTPGFTRTLDAALGLVYALLAAWLITRLYDTIHTRYLVPLAQRSSGAYDDQVLPLIRKGLRIIVWVLAIIVGLNNAGYDVGTVIAGLGIGGLAFALAAQDTVGNMFGGIILFGQKPFMIGDLIEFEGKQYIVKEIGWRATVAHDWTTGYRVTIPNSKFTGGVIANVSAEKGYWWSYTLKLAPDTTYAQMQQALDDIRDSVCCHPDVDDHRVRFETIGNYAMEVLVLYHVKDFDERWRVINEVSLDLLRRMESHRVRFAAPMQMNVSLDGRGGPGQGADPETAAANKSEVF